MAIPKTVRGLRFPCECVSASNVGYSDPWAEITRRNLLPNGTKEQIINLVAHEPKTVSQLAEDLDLSIPSVHTHINDMLKSELLRESEEREKKYPTERYYEPNFPVFRAKECAELKKVCEEMSKQIVAMFEKRRAKIERAFRNTSLPDEGWELSEVTPCLFTNIYRSARTELETRGLLAAREKHANGAEWIFWAEDHGE